MTKKFILSLILCCFSSTLTSAHVGLSYPVGNENFKTGEAVEIHWFIAVDHGDCTWEIYFSTDNGSNWTAIAENLDKSQLEFDWTAPETSTSYARIKVIQYNFIGINYEAVSGRFTISQTATDIPSEENEPIEYSLLPAYPNPFNSTTRISFNLKKDEHVRLDIYNLTGEKVACIINGEMPAGFHEVNWNAGRFTSGVYLYSIQTKGFAQTRKVILIK